MVHAYLVANAGDDKIHDIFYGGWLVVKSGHCRQDHGPSLGAGYHVAKVNHMKGSFPGHYHQFSPFFQVNIGCPGY